VSAPAGPALDGATAADDPRIGLRAATTLNMLSMIGAGPFLTIPLIIQSMQGPQALLGWFAGAAIALADGLVWAELGAALPRSGGGYQYLLEAYGPKGPGRLMSFLFLWQTIIAFPLTMASGAVGFAFYTSYLVPSLGPWHMKAIAALVCLLAAALVYRRIDRVGRWGTVFGAVVLVAVGWVIVDGVVYGQAAGLTIPPGAWTWSGAFWTGLGTATLYSVYDYLGYNNICSYADEVRRPAVTIPRSIVVSVLLVATLYVAMNVSILSAMPWQEAAASEFVVSAFVARLQGEGAAAVMTVLILVTIFAGIFAGMCATSRIPYAAAVDGRFFEAFARLHPSGRFPSFSVAFAGIASALACLLELDALITALVAIYVVIGALPIIGAVTALRRTRPDIVRPFSSRAYPLPSVVAAAGWIGILLTSGVVYIAAGFALLGVGIASYLWRARRAGEWPFKAGV
jgi:amino acid transporter